MDLLPVKEKSVDSQERIQGSWKALEEQMQWYQMLPESMLDTSKAIHLKKEQLSRKLSWITYSRDPEVIRSSNQDLDQDASIYELINERNNVHVKFQSYLIKHNSHECLTRFDQGPSEYIMADWLSVPEWEKCFI